MGGRGTGWACNRQDSGVISSRWTTLGPCSKTQRCAESSPTVLVHNHHRLFCSALSELVLFLHICPDSIGSMGHSNEPQTRPNRTAQNAIELALFFGPCSCINQNAHLAAHYQQFSLNLQCHITVMTLSRPMLRGHKHVPQPEGSPRSCAILFIQGTVGINSAAKYIGAYRGACTTLQY